MATIDIRRTHCIGKGAARQAAQHVAERLEKKLGVRYEWAGDDLVFGRTGASGRISVTESEVHVEITLSLLLRPTKGMVEQKVYEYLDESLGRKP